MKKLDVNQELCRKVQIMLAGAKMGEVAELLGISKTTVSRIKAAGFDPEQYRKNTTERVEKENQEEETVCIPLTPGKVIRVDQKPGASGQAISVPVWKERTPVNGSARQP